MALKHFTIPHFLFSTLWIQAFCNYQNGFLSLSCSRTTPYTDPSNIQWIPDNSYINTGNISSILPVRFFPEQNRRNCYHLPLNNSSPLALIRAQFLYKNYDSLRKPPVFTLSLGTAIVASVNLSKNDPWIEEFIWPVNKDRVFLCLHSIPNGGYPVISSVEVRPLPNGAYEDGVGDFPFKSLRKTYRINSGYTNGSLRYPMDRFDRIWDSDENYTPFHVSTGFTMLLNFNLSTLIENPPLSVLQTARVLAKKHVLTYNLALDTQADYFVLLYFAGILPVSPSFDVFINGDLLQSNYSVTMLEASVLRFTRQGIRTLNVTLKSIDFYPQINGIEVYQIVDIPLEASSTTVSALQVIQHSTGLDFEWEDDPCYPISWEHIGCEGSLVTSLELSDIDLRSISPTFGDLLDLKTLDLHNTSLAGEIQNLGSLQHLEKLNLSFNQLTSFGTELNSLVSLQSLDLQNNSLEGTVPDGFGQLENLHLLNLENNNLEGTLPGSLNRESIEVRTSGNPCLSFSSLSCTDVSSNPSIETPQVTIFATKKPSKSNHIAVILGASAGTIILALVVISVSVFIYSKKKTVEIPLSDRTVTEMRNWNAARIFTYKEIKAATNNFKEVIGRGSFGSVYVGKLSDGKQVAVKVRYDKTQLGADSFVNEVHLLSRIHHQNLVGLEGFCYESKQQILVYEYLPGGSLADHLYGSNRQKVTLSWVRRMKIAVDAAKGLDYLHNGSEPRIIHRDVKCSNILLDKDMNAKVCDFGLSKQLMQADASHVTTVVKGTAGYLDPEYYSTQQLTEKSDVYSFGVVVLELICGREPLRHLGTPDSFNLVLWAKPYLQAGAFEIVDDSIKGTFDAESMRKAATVAVKAVDRDASLRPNIAQVLAELKEAYNIQLAYLAARDM